MWISRLYLGCIVGKKKKKLKLGGVNTFTLFMVFIAWPYYFNMKQETGWKGNWVIACDMCLLCSPSHSSCPILPIHAHMNNWKPFCFIHSLCRKPGTFQCTRWTLYLLSNSALCVFFFNFFFLILKGCKWAPLEVSRKGRDGCTLAGRCFWLGFFFFGQWNWNLFLSTPTSYPANQSSHSISISPPENWSDIKMRPGDGRDSQRW